MEDVRRMWGGEEKRRVVHCQMGVNPGIQSEFSHGG